MWFKYPSSLRSRLSAFDKWAGDLWERLEARAAFFAFFRRRLHLIVFFASALSLLLFQSYNVGFERMSKKDRHHGWVSAHNLALTSKVALPNPFGAFTYSRAYSKSQKTYTYFRRTTFLFPFLQRLLTMTWTSDFKTQIYLNRQLVNLVLIASIWLGFLILGYLLESRNAAMAAALLAFSSVDVIFYKDLIAPDPVSVLGVLLVVYGMVAYFREPSNRRALYLSAIASVSVGWGYSSLPLMVVWIAWSIAGLALERKGIAGFVRGILRLTSLRVFALMTGMTALYLGANILGEAAKRDVPLAETEIVESAARRVFLTKAKETPALEKKVAWSRFIPEQLKTVESRFRLGTEIKGKRSALHLLMLCLLTAALVGAFYRWTNSKRIVAASLFLSGPLWLIPMRGFTAYHLYASLMYFGIPMVAIGAVLFVAPRRWGAPALIAAFLVFNYLNINVNQLKNRSTLAQVTTTEDFQAIAGRLVKGDLVYYDGGFRKLLKNSPYAVGYYLGDQHVSVKKKHADYYISKKRGFAEENLTPKNRKYFLFAAPKEDGL